MPILTTKISGSRVKVADINSIITALLNIMTNETTNHLVSIVGLGDGSDNLHKGIAANNLAGLRYLVWDESEQRWGSLVDDVFTAFGDVFGGDLLGNPLTDSTGDTVIESSTGNQVVITPDSGVVVTYGTDVQAVFPANYIVGGTPLHVWSVTGASGSLTVRNGTSTSGRFLPQIFNTPSTAAEYADHATLVTDTGAVAASVFRVFKSGGFGTFAALTTRPLFEWQNNTTAVMQMAADGTLKLNKIACLTGSTVTFGSTIVVTEIDGPAAADLLIKATAGYDLNVQLGDNAGANTLNIKDSDGTVAATVDSDGAVSVGASVAQSTGSDLIKQSLVAKVSTVSSAAFTTVLTIAVPTDGTVKIVAYAMAIGSAGTNQDLVADLELRGTVKNIGGTLTVVISSPDTVGDEATGWAIQVDDSGTDAVVQVQGDAASTVKWSVSADIVFVRESQ